MEWKGCVSSFNSLKILCWKDRFEAILKGEIPHPVSVIVDVTNGCNLHCCFCQNHEEDVGKQTMVPEEELLWLADALARLGVGSVHFSGCGEGLMHPGAGRFLRRLRENWIDVGLVTNGVYLNNFLDDVLESCRWVGVSIDAGNAETYAEMKKTVPMNFFRAINNMERMVRARAGKSPQVTFKFLFHPLNYQEIYEATVLARSIHVDEMQIRPCYMNGVVWYPNIVKEVLEEGRRAVELSTSSFKVSFVTHRSDDSFIKTHHEKCEITPIAGLTFAADGNVYLCSDLRYTEQGLLCSWRDIESTYGSEKHKEKLKNLDVKKCPPQCKDGFYQEILERVFRNDEMFYKFV